MADDPFLMRQIEKNESSRCEMCKQVATLPKSKQRQLYLALLDKRIDHHTIHDVLDDWGVKTSPTVISYHRNNKRPKCMKSLKDRVQVPEQEKEGGTQ